MASVTKQSYYEILKISKDASDEEIRTSYKSLALALHPDKNPDPNATKHFQKLTEAYTVLKDPKTRSQYDRKGTIDEYDDFEEEDYSDEEDEEEYECTCGRRHSRRDNGRYNSRNFEDFFAKMFFRHFTENGYRGFYDVNDDDASSFYRGFKARRSSDEWSSARGHVPTSADLKSQGQAPDKLARPKIFISADKRNFIVEWAKKEPRKRVDTWHVSYSTNGVGWIETKFPTDRRSGEIPIKHFGKRYAFRTAATNATGTSEWSENVEVMAPPEPHQPNASKESAKAKESTKAQHGTAAPQPQQQAVARMKQLTAELEAAVKPPRDITRLRNAAKASRDKLLQQPPPAANSPSDPVVIRLLTALEAAEKVIRASEEKQRVEAVAALKSAAKKGSNELFAQAEARLESLMPTNPSDVAAVKDQIRSARDELKQVRRDAAMKASADLQTAMAGSDIENLREAIAHAAEYSLPLKEAKKVLRDLEAQWAKEEEEAAAAAREQEEAEAAAQEEENQADGTDLAGEEEGPAEEELPAQEDEEACHGEEEVPPDEENAAEFEQVESQAEQVEELSAEPEAAPLPDQSRDARLVTPSGHPPPADPVSNWESADDIAEAAAYAHAHAAFGLNEDSGSSFFSFPPHAVPTYTTSASSSSTPAPTSSFLASAFATPVPFSVSAAQITKPGLAQPDDGDIWLMNWFQNRYGDQATAFVDQKATSPAMAPIKPAPVSKPAPITPPEKAALPSATASTTSAPNASVQLPKPTALKKPAAKKPAAPLPKAKIEAVQPTAVDDDEALRQALELSRLEFEQEEKERREAEKKAKKAVKLAMKKYAADATTIQPTGAIPKGTTKSSAVASFPAANAPAPAAPSAAPTLAAPKCQPASASGPAGRPAPQSQPSRSLWVGNLSQNVTEEMLRKEFSPFGAIDTIRVLNRKNPACAFIDFLDEAQATNAKASLFRKHLLDREMHIYFSMRAPEPKK